MQLDTGCGGLKEGIAVKNTLKRLQRMLSHERILEEANRLSLREAVGKITDKTVLALIRINTNPRLKAEVQKAARLEKNQKKQQPKFVYYRLLQGVKNLLAGMKRMFLFQWKFKARKALLKNLPPLLPFLTNPTAFFYDMEYGL